MKKDRSEPAAASIEYSGPEALRLPILRAMRQVVDPELSLSILDVGLVYGVVVSAKNVQVRMTMTSPACPVAGVIEADLESELDQVLPESYTIDIQIVWEPAWEPSRMSSRARLIMGW